MSSDSQFGEFACEQILSRRGFLSNSFSGLAGIGLASLLSRDFAAAECDVEGDWKADRGLAQFAPKAKRVLQIFCPGGASHLDLWDYKPALEKHHGEPLPGEENLVTFQGKNGNLMKSPWPFAPAGQNGKMISTLLPNMARHIDDIAFIHSMQSKTNTHGPGLRVHEYGHDLRRLSQRRCLGWLCAWQREREPAGVRCDSRYSRRAAERQRRIGATVFCRPSFRPW